MTEAGRGIQTVVVTEAVRDATIGGRRSSTARPSRSTRTTASWRSTTTAEQCVLAAMTSLPPGYELVTIFYGDGADLAETEAMSRQIGAILPGTEIEVRHGGQPFYRYLISAE